MIDAQGFKKLYTEVGDLYKGLSYFVFEHVKHIGNNHTIVIDVCYMKDNRKIAALSAQVCTSGMSLPIYQEIFEEGELKGRTISFLQNLKQVLPEDKEIVIIMDAGFHA